jgi:hypothetical protein
MRTAWPESGSSADGRLDCNPGSCVYREGGRSVTLIRDPQSFDRGQCRADLVISAAPAWKLCPGARIIDWVDSYRNGG